MFKTLAEIEAQVKAGEDSISEFKEMRFKKNSVVSPNTEDIAGEMTAFANTEGGAVFFGVSDDGGVTGVPKERLNAVESWVVNIATNNCDPPIRPILRKIILKNKDGEEAAIFVVVIPRSHFVHRTSGGRWYMRVGSTKGDLTQQELARLFQERGRAFVFDETSVPQAARDDFDQSTIEAFFGEKPRIPYDRLLTNTKALTQDDEGDPRPTIAGLLVFGKKPREHIPSAYIEAGVYRGVRQSSEYLVHSEQIQGTVVQQIEAAVAFVDRLMLRPATKDVGRKDYPQFELSAVHEAIVNAVAHRDYSISGAKIRLFLFDDRLELYSPGSLPNTVTLETMRYRQFTRNQLLVSFLSKIVSQKTLRYFIEERGEGVDKILTESEKHSGRTPEYRLIDDELMLTIWSLPSPHGKRELNEKLGPSSKTYALSILDKAPDIPPLKNDEIE